MPEPIAQFPQILGPETSELEVMAKIQFESLVCDSHIDLVLKSLPR